MGQASSILRNCAEVVTKDQCMIEFGSPNNVTKFGKVEQGGFEGNPDIAGLGVFIAFAATSLYALLACILKGFILTGSAIFRCIKTEGDNCTCCDDNDEESAKKQKKSPNSRFAFIHDELDAAIVSVGDAQLFLVLAFVISFSFQSQCDVSLYHYEVAVNTIAVGLSGAVLSFLLVEDTQKKAFISTILRWGAFVACMAGFVPLENDNHRRPGDHEPGKLLSALPSLNQTDSVLVLPAFCILKRNLNPFSNLTGDEQLHLTHEGRERDLTSNTVVILIPFVLVSCIRLCSLLRLTWICGTTSPIRGGLRITFRALKVGITVVVAYNMISAVIFLAKLRMWMDESVWLQKEDGGNPEQDLQGIGQMAPLIALVSIVIAVGNILSFVIGRSCSCCKNYPLEDDPSPGDGSGAPMMVDQQGYKPTSPPVFEARIDSFINGGNMYRNQRGSK